MRVDRRIRWSPEAAPYRRARWRRCPRLPRAASAVAATSASASVCSVQRNVEGQQHACTLCGVPETPRSPARSKTLLTDTASHTWALYIRRSLTPRPLQERGGLLSGRTNNLRTLRTHPCTYSRCLPRVILRPRHLSVPPRPSPSLPVSPCPSPSLPTPLLAHLPVECSPKLSSRGAPVAALCTGRTLHSLRHAVW